MRSLFVVSALGAALLASVSSGERVAWADDPPILDGSIGWAL